MELAFFWLVRLHQLTHISLLCPVLIGQLAGQSEGDAVPVKVTQQGAGVFSADFRAENAGGLLFTPAMAGRTLPVLIKAVNETGNE